MKEYQVYDGDSIIGSVKAEPNGMFYLLKVSCRPISKKPERIVMTGSYEEKILGLCVPEGADMTLIKRVRKSELEDKAVRFSIMTVRENKDAGERICLENLPQAYIGENGTLMFADQDQSSSNPTGQWSDPMISE